MTSSSNRLFGPDTRPCVQKRVIVTPTIGILRGGGRKSILLNSNEMHYLLLTNRVFRANYNYAIDINKRYTI